MMQSVVLARRPRGNPVEADFAVVEAPLPEVTDGTFLTHNSFISLDAGFRNWMNEDSGDEAAPRRLNLHSSSFGIPRPAR